MQFQQIVVMIAAITLIGLLTWIGYGMYQSEHSAKFPPVSSDCPDYWTANKNGCVNIKHLGSCNTGKDNTMSFNKKGYQLIKKVIPQDMAKLASNYLLVKEQVLNTLLKNKVISPYQQEHGINNDTQVMGAFSIYGDVLMDCFLLKLHKQIEKITGEKLMNERAEKANGRAAMIGFVAAVGAYLMTGQLIPGVW